MANTTLAICMLFAVFVASACAQSDPVSGAVNALRGGDAARAEQTLRTELHDHPDSADALSVLAVDPGHLNARLQLARLALERKAPPGSV